MDGDKQIIQFWSLRPWMNIADALLEGRDCIICPAPWGRADYGLASPAGPEDQRSCHATACPWNEWSSMPCDRAFPACASGAPKGVASPLTTNVYPGLRWCLGRMSEGGQSWVMKRKAPIDMCSRMQNRCASARCTAESRSSRWQSAARRAGGVRRAGRRVDGVNCQGFGPLGLLQVDVVGGEPHGGKVLPAIEDFADSLRLRTCLLHQEFLAERSALVLLVLCPARLAVPARVLATRGYSRL